MIDNSKHIVSSYDKILNHIDELLAATHETMVTQLTMTLSAFANRDLAMAQKVIAEDKKINIFDNAINTACMLLLIKQPMAYDLRYALMAIAVSSNLERMGDNIRNVARLLDKIDNADTSIEALVQRMGEILITMITDMSVALSSQNDTLANDIFLRDKTVDDLYQQICFDTLNVMKTHPQYLDSYANYLFIARYLERVGDHCCNISEHLHFLVTGERHRYG